jgi:hypothetical protein
MYAAVPSIANHSFKKKLATVKAQKAQRIKHYLYPKASIKPFLTKDQRNRKQGNSNERNRKQGNSNDGVMTV